MTSHFGARAFEVLVHGYKGKNWRLGCAKTHAGIDPYGCKHDIRANRITLRLKKEPQGEIWFDLFKKKCIGDKEEA